MQTQTSDTLQLAMTSPIGTLSSIRRFEQSALRVPSPAFRTSPGGTRTASRPLQCKFWESQSVFGLMRHFRETKWDFRLQLRGDRRFGLSPDKTTLYLLNPKKHYQGVARVFPAPSSLPLVAFLSQYHSGQFHVEESMRVFSRDGAYGIESHCHALVAGEPMVNRCVLIRHRRSIIALSLSAKAAARKDANREFDTIIKHLRFGR